MTGTRPFLSFVTIAFLLLAQLHIWQASGCSMCGASCRCAPHAAGASCSLRSMGCGGNDGGSTTGSVSPLRAVLVAASTVEPRVAVEAAFTAASHPPPQRPRPPLDHPPRVSC